MDQIIIKGLRVRGKHGTTTQEITFGQEFEVDVTLDLDLKPPCYSDDVETAIDKRELITLISREISGDHCNLPEFLAQRIADRLLEAYPFVAKVEVYLQQPQSPIPGDFDFIGIRIQRP